MTPQEIEALKADRDALAAQNKILLGALNLALPSVEACYKQHMAAWETLFLLLEAAKATPQQCLLDVQAEAGRAGWNACVDWLVENSSVDLFTDGEAGQARDVGEEYAESVRKGGAE